LKNDYKELMAIIEKALHEHHASLRNSTDPKDAESPSLERNAHHLTQAVDRTRPDPAFAKVNSVAPSSPAHEAGLKVGDKILTFGPVHSGNHQNLQKIAEVVQRNEGVRQFLFN
jgi:26S proteasome regulatory subunit N4